MHACTPTSANTSSCVDAGLNTLSNSNRLEIKPVSSCGVITWASNTRIARARREQTWQRSAANDDSRQRGCTCLTIISPSTGKEVTSASCPGPARRCSFSKIGLTRQYTRMLPLATEQPQRNKQQKFTPRGTCRTTRNRRTPLSYFSSTSSLCNAFRFRDSAMYSSRSSSCSRSFAATRLCEQHSRHTRTATQDRLYSVPSVHGAIVAITWVCNPTMGHLISPNTQTHPVATHRSPSA